MNGQNEFWTGQNNYNQWNGPNNTIHSAFGYNSSPMQDQLAQLRERNRRQSQNLMQSPKLNNIIWVQGEVGAKSFPIENGNTVPLWDSENQTIYIKTVDMFGMPSMRIIDYTEREDSRISQNESIQTNKEYVTREEYNSLADRVGALESVPAKKKAPKEETDG